MIVGAAAGVMGIYRYFKSQRLLEKEPFDSATTFRRNVPKIGATIRVHVDQERNLSSAVDERRFIEQPYAASRSACGSFCPRVR